jgi:hypothetical protein
LQLAHQRWDGPVVGVLLAAGAHAPPLFRGFHAHPFALCIYYGEVDSLREVLLNTGWDANWKLAYSRGGSIEGERGAMCRAVHLCVVPPKASYAETTRPPQLEALKMLVSEFGADVNAPDLHGDRPLHALTDVAPSHQARTLDALLSLGADLEAVNSSGHTPIVSASREDRRQLVKLLLSRGASAEVTNRHGFTPLMQACHFGDPALVLAVLRASSQENRRRLVVGYSALDTLVASEHADDAAKARLIPELLRAGLVAALPDNAARVLPFAARLIQRQEGELSRRQAELTTSWRAHEAYVKLAFDFVELREAEEAVARREARVAELEAELRALGVGTEDTEEEEDDEGEGGGDEDEGAASGSEEGKSGSGSDDDEDDDDDDDDEARPSVSAAADLARALQGVRCGDEDEKKVKEEVDEQESG